MIYQVRYVALNNRFNPDVFEDFAQKHLAAWWSEDLGGLVTDELGAQCLIYDFQREESMSFVITILGFAAGELATQKIFLQDFDFEANGGRGEPVFTADIKNAKKFKSTTEILLYWKTQSKTNPIRDDGMPNRPLTSFIISIDRVHD